MLTRGGLAHQPCLSCTPHSSLSLHELPAPIAQKREHKGPENKSSLKCSLWLQHHPRMHRCRGLPRPCGSCSCRPTASAVSGCSRRCLWMTALLSPSSRRCATTASGPTGTGSPPARAQNVLPAVSKEVLCVHTCMCAPGPHNLSRLRASCRGCQAQPE